MPELPDIAVYVEVLGHRAIGRRLTSVRVKGPFLVRSVEPGIEEFEGRACTTIERLGKRIVFGFEGDLFLVLHLMIAGRLLWKAAGTRATGKIDLASFEFEGAASGNGGDGGDGNDGGVLLLTEAGTKKRASLYGVRGRDALREHDRGGLEVMTCEREAFGRALTRENRTLKRALADPRSFSGIGNAYSDEILHAAKLSPIKLTRAMTGEEVDRLYASCRATLGAWIERLRREFELDKPPGRFPRAGEITAFRPEFAVHGKYGQKCPVCSDPVQRIVHAENETNYCATCQTNGKVLADRSLSRLLKDDWPRTVEEWEGEFGEG